MVNSLKNEHRFSVENGRQKGGRRLPYQKDHGASGGSQWEKKTGSRGKGGERGRNSINRPRRNVPRQITIAVIALVGIGFALLLASSGSGEKCKYAENLQVPALIKRVTNEQNFDPAQKRDNYKLFAPFVRHAEAGNPWRPLCIVVVPEVKSNVGKAGMTKLVQALGDGLYVSPSRVLIIHGGSYNGWSEQEVNRNVTTRVSDHLSSSFCDIGLVLITDVDQLPRPNHLLWRFCDDDYAPFKKAIFMFAGSGSVLGSMSSASEPSGSLPTINGSLPTLSSASKGTMEKIKSYFRRRWEGTKGTGGDIFPPLWVRIANLVLTLS